MKLFCQHVQQGQQNHHVWQAKIPDSQLCSNKKKKKSLHSSFSATFCFKFSFSAVKWFTTLLADQCFLMSSQFEFLYFHCCHSLQLPLSVPWKMLNASQSTSSATSLCPLLCSSFLACLSSLTFLPPLWLKVSVKIQSGWLVVLANTKKQCCNW